MKRTIETANIFAFIKDFIYQKEVQDIMKQCIIQGDKDLKTFEVISLIIDETEAQGSTSTIQISIRNNNTNGVTEYKKTYNHFNKTL